MAVIFRLKLSSPTQYIIDDVVGRKKTYSFKVSRKYTPIKAAQIVLKRLKMALIKNNDTCYFADADLKHIKIGDDSDPNWHYRPSYRVIYIEPNQPKEKSWEELFAEQLGDLVK